MAEGEIVAVEQISRELEREVRMGAALLERREAHINQQAEIEAKSWKKDYRNKRPGTYRHHASVPIEEFAAFGTKLPGCWDDQEFVKDYFKRNKHLVSNT